jgi:hypothetical protein
MGKMRKCNFSLSSGFALKPRPAQKPARLHKNLSALDHAEQNRFDGADECLTNEPHLATPSIRPAQFIGLQRVEDRIRQDDGLRQVDFHPVYGYDAAIRNDRREKVIHDRCHPLTFKDKMESGAAMSGKLPVWTLANG